MSGKTRILLTGVTGYIGSAIGRELEAAGYTVVGVSRRGLESSQSRESGSNPTGQGEQKPAGDAARALAGSPESLRSGYRPAELVICDLSDAEGTAGSLAAIQPCQAIVHTAVHNAARPANGAAVHGSVRMLQNLHEAVRGWDARWVHLSSVSVYGDADRPDRVRVGDSLRPASEYGRSKLECEEFLKKCNLRDCRILRITPVYSPDARRNLAVRVYLPGTPLRLRIFPEPSHSLCSLESLVRRVCEHIRDGEARVLIEHTGDPFEHRQNELAKQFTHGPIIPFPELLFRPIYGILSCIPGRTAYRLRCVYWKLLRSNRYEVPHIQFVPDASRR